MPHIVVEASSGAVGDARALLESLVRTLSECETVSSASVKARYREYDRWEMGVGAPAAFVHVTVSILIGRSSELKTHISNQMVSALCERLGVPLGSAHLAVTLELREMDAAFYRK